jgi:glycosyltransferase involved in cell wall biosynthesis
MKVLLAVAWYFPDAVGGSEVYVRGLARHLKSAGTDVSIAVPTLDGRAVMIADIDGIPVQRFLADNVGGRMDVTRDAPAAWHSLLDTLAPDVVDLHSLTSHLGVPHLRAARRRGARTLTTLHLPELTCARGTFMRFGRTPCDGDLAIQPCTACRLQVQGVPRLIGRALSLVPRTVGSRAGRLPRIMQRPLVAHLAHDARRALVAAVAAESDRMVAVSAWQADVLRRNGVLHCKIRVCRQGVSAVPDVVPPPAPPGAVLRVGFVGRYDPTKGVHVLVDAFRRLPADLPIQLHLWGIARTPEAVAYRDLIAQRALGLPSVTMHPESSPEAIYPRMDVLAVPSIYFETGPLVVLEAQAWGLPVIGSNIGGIAERVTPGVDGVLVPPNDAGALAKVLRGWVREPARLRALRPRRRVRTMADAACDTLRTYRELLQVPA